MKPIPCYLLALGIGLSLCSYAVAQENDDIDSRLETRRFGESSPQKLPGEQAFLPSITPESLIEKENISLTQESDEDIQTQLQDAPEQYIERVQENLNPKDEGNIQVQLQPLPEQPVQLAQETLSQIEEQEIRQQLQQLLERQEQLEAENARLREEIQRLNQRLNELAPSDDIADTTEEQIQQTVEDVITEREQKQPQVGLRPGGGGFFIAGENYELRILGYVQALGSLFDSDLEREDGNGDFSVRRARIDFLATLFDDYQIFIEFDGAPGTAQSTDSDFALVEARLNWEITEEALQVRAGKFTTPFSTENFRSSRSIDTVERYLALNSMFLLPALDVQFGAMLHGKLGEEQRLGYFLGLFNGNGSANANLSDNNDSKEFQTKLTYRATDELNLGLGFDYSIEREQTLSLVDLGFNRYVSVPIEGERFGVSSDLFWEKGRWSFRTEGLAFWFDSPTGSDVGLYGGFIQPGYFLSGDANGGVQALLRGEVAHLDADTGSDGDTLWALTAGINWFVNPNVRLQVNGTLHFFNGSSSIRGFDDDQVIPQLLTELQFKF
ncbi:MAG: porin [Coleofasciculus sp. C1-SOL-03]|uniref:porin n=1 Tax=Coleofasciculus sp. C1-SOL-03 TaxID=3069522 RepID=UPI0032FC16E3